jgi:hypothetical protein
MKYFYNECLPLISLFRLNPIFVGKARETGTLRVAS